MSEDPIEQELGRRRMADPSEKLPERVLRAAEKAWAVPAAEEVPWMLPVFRFAALVIAAYATIFGFNRLDPAPGFARDTPVQNRMHYPADTDVPGFQGMPSLVVTTRRGEVRQALEQRRQLRALLNDS